MWRQRAVRVLAVMAGIALMVASGSGDYRGSDTYNGSGTYRGSDTYNGSGAYSGSSTYSGSGAYNGSGTYRGSDTYNGSGAYSGSGAYNEGNTYDGIGTYRETMGGKLRQAQDSSGAQAADLGGDGDKAGKQKIVLGAPWRTSDFKWEAASFNAQSEEYYVELLQLSELGEGEIYPDEITADLIDVRYMHIGRAAAEGRLEPLDDWLAQSEVLDREDFLENVLASATYNDRLYAIPRGFTVKTMVCKDSLWDWPEKFDQKALIDFYENYHAEHPMAKLFDVMARDDLIYYCVGHDPSIWPDYETGSCDFESEEFKEVLRFLKRISKTRNTLTEYNLPEALASDRVLFDEFYLERFQDIQLAPAMFGEPVAYVGYPGKDGGQTSVLEPSEILAINASSGHKEGAWAFLEFYLSHWDGAWQADGIPSNKEALQAKIKEELLRDATARFYTEEIGGWEYTYHKCTQKEIAQIQALIALADVQNAYCEEDYDVLRIISEESLMYFENKRSVDYVASVIQARVQQYMQREIDK